METQSAAPVPASVQRSDADCPPLFAGDRLSRAEFERRYLAHPDIKKAELIEGVVYMPSPVHYDSHAAPHLALATWLGVYVAHTPGLAAGDNATIRLDNQNEPQPDLLLRIDSEYGGVTTISGDDYIVGPPELVVEIAASSASYDMHDKKLVYARNGVQEYLVFLTFERTVRWFVLREGEFAALEADDQGILRSTVFPGLWLAPDAVWEQDLSALLAVLQRGMAAAEHGEFVAKLQAAGG